MEIKENISFLFQLRRKINFFLKPNYRKKRKKKIIFILSTGRCGSTSITKMFNQHSQFIAFHENIPELIKLSTNLAEAPETKNEIYRQLKDIFKKRKWEGEKGQIVVHSDHRMWNLVDFLSNYFPNSSFIHLMRNPYGSVQSYLPRGWYSENDIKGGRNIYGKFRLQGDKIGAMSSGEWKSLSRLEKCIWYWNYVNTNIEYQLKKLKRDRVTTLKLENLQEEMNEYIKKKYNIQPEFRFSNIVTNQSNSVSKKLILNEEILKVIKNIDPRFYSTYYDND